MAYQEEFFESNLARWRRWVPWLHLWRIPWMALEWRKVLICLVSVWLIQIIATKSLGPQGITPEFTSQLNQVLSPTLTGWPELKLLHRLLFVPVHEVLMPSTYMGSGSAKGWMQLTAWVIWSIAGLWVSRIAAFEFVNGYPGPFVGSLRYTLARLISTVTVFFPLIVMLILVHLIAVFVTNLVGHQGVFSIVPLLSGGYIVAMGTVVILGWPIMLAAIAVDNSDGFDALSRTLSYVLNRFGYFLWLGLVGTVVTTVCYVLAIFFLAMSYKIGWDFYGISTQAVPPISLLETYHVLLSIPYQGNIGADYPGALSCLGFLKLLVIAIGASLFWTTMTTIYFLLRLAEDRTPLTEIFISSIPKEPGVPLVGKAERERTMQQHATPQIISPQSPEESE
jgi:hypothetical protein